MTETSALPEPSRNPDGTMRKGHSANPRGRPAKSRNMLTIFNDLRDEKISLKVDGKPVKMTRMEAWVTNLWNKAIGCDAKASAVVMAIDVWRGRVMFPELKRQVYAVGSRWAPDVLLVEDKGSGTSLIAQLTEEDSPHLPRPIARTPKEDKVTRMAAQTAWIEQGHVHLPADAAWLAAFQSEML